ncbi:MAG TPA: DUF481 domain-containing protein [Bryobacteraceae bacterium]|nr:DUF481 domain-containing protein [Bryobacteraceae bacterium]
MENHYFAAVVFVAAALIQPAIGNAADAQPGKHEVADWWQKSSVATTPIPEPVFFHVDGSLSYMNAQGNTDGSTFDAGAAFDVRKWRFTNYFSAQFSKRDITYGFGGGNVNYTENTVRDQLEYDLTKRAMLVGGIEDYENTLIFMDKRFTVFGGAGLAAVERENQRLLFTGGLGHVDFRFDRDAMLRVNPTSVADLATTTPTSGGALIAQTWHWRVSPRLSFDQTGTYMTYFNHNLGHRWDIGANFNVPLTKVFSCVFGYQIKDEDNAYVRALGVKLQDRTLTMGFKVSWQGELK